MQPKPQRGRIPDNAEHKLLEFVGRLVLDASRTDPHLTPQDIADWLARVMVGSRKVSR